MKAKPPASHKPRLPCAEAPVVRDIVPACNEYIGALGHHVHAAEKDMIYYKTSPSMLEVLGV